MKLIGLKDRLKTSKDIGVGKLNNIMTFKKLEHLLVYTVHKIEEKIIMKPKEAKNKIKVNKTRE